MTAVGRAAWRGAAPLTPAVWLAAASVVELLVLRTFTRTAIHIPALPALAEPYEVVASLGRFAYFLAVVLLAVVLPGLAFALWRPGLAVGRAGAVALVVFAASALGTERVTSSLVADVTTIAVVACIAASVATGGARRAAVPVACFGVAFALGGAYTVLQDLAQRGTPAGEGRWLLVGAEAAALGFALSSPLLARAPLPRLAKVAGGGVGLLLLAMLLSEGGSTVRILLLWNEGLTGTFPAVAYAAGGGALAASVVALLRERSTLAATALVLFVTGGIGLHSTYQSALVVAGLAVLLLPVARGRERE